MKKHFKLALFLSFTLLYSAFALAEQKSAPSLSSSDPTLRVAVDLVMLDVSVTDENGKFVKNLSKDSFKVYEDRVQQSPTFFSAEEAPVTWGIVIDRSGSMSDMKAVYDAASHMINEGTAEDEMFLMTFSRKIDSISDITL